jgi:hypothetical protein
MLIPKRLVERLNHEQSNTFYDLLLHAWGKATLAHRRAYRHWYWRWTLILIVGTPLTWASFAYWTLTYHPEIPWPWYYVTLLWIFVVPFLALLIPLFAVLTWTLCFSTGRAVALAFKSELAALARAESPENTVLGRLRRGSGEKR